MSGIVKIVGAGIGLASEAIHHSRAKSKAARDAEDNSRSRSQSGQNTPLEETRSPSDSRSVSRQVSGQDGSPAAGPSSYASNNTTVAGPSSATNAPGASNDPPAYLTPEEEKRQLAEKERQLLESDSFGYYDDEAVWELDDMAEYMDPPAYSEAAGETPGSPVSPADDGSRRGSGANNLEEAAVGEAEGEGEEREEIKKQQRMVRELVRMAGPTPTPMRRIPCPVIIPQRRPRTKARGFVRAYAPVLSDCGINQDVFLRFLKDWYLASKASPWIDVVYVAAGIVGFVPEMGAQIASVVVQVVAGTARELQSRHRNNTFLDRANQELFMPRGLFAMVMAFKDDMPNASGGGLLGGLKSAIGKSLVSTERLDINQTTVKYSQLAALGSNGAANKGNKTKAAMRNLRKNNGMTYTELELPQAAELVYPDLDNAAERDLAAVEGGGEVPKNSKWHRSGKFVSSYLDRRAQAEYAGTHQGSSMAVPADARKPFMSRFADPNHPANSGSLVALLSGGKIVPDNNRRSQGLLGRGVAAGLGGGLGGSLVGRGMGGGSGYHEDGSESNSYWDRRRRQGPIGIGISLIGAGVSKIMEQRQQSQNRAIDSGNPNGNGNGNGFFDDRRDNDQHQQGQMQYANSSAPYGGSSASSNPPAPYGSSNPPAPYGGSANYQNEQDYGCDEQQRDNAGYNAGANYQGGSTQYNNMYNRPNNRGVGGGAGRGIKKIMQQDVLYLLIVNLPTDEEVQTSIAQLERLTSHSSR
ncbi:hypothetical protein SPBR_02435 [Sporothrix brasiliensis 5110]|uniref:Uncharacterized protein n=1 Tax=Sporothrix brasiliensis 5110 TaxID=1398154 RepID=A0A0C2J6M5_9PEZI|nr:uncharacterized protein SPBR_02435 [Sporothrix brasiliensis 5110]KIH92652.1 hypothetical protein SPBR_02435 [Sporothrix brasiliensis 5110]